MVKTFFDNCVLTNFLNYSRISLPLFFINTILNFGQECKMLNFRFLNQNEWGAGKEAKFFFYFSFHIQGQNHFRLLLQSSLEVISELHTKRSI